LTERRHSIGARGQARVNIDTMPNFTLILTKAISISKVYREGVEREYGQEENKKKKRINGI
jgi:hypothetical protein